MRRFSISEKETCRGRKRVEFGEREGGRWQREAGEAGEATEPVSPSCRRGCISHAVALTSPRDACRLSVVSSLFRAVADSDSVWARFLPPDIYSVLSRASGASPPPPRFSSLKQLYFSLCDTPILLDGGKMSFSLSRSSGRKCYMLSVRALSIAWGNVPAYWRWASIPDSRFLEVAELISVCWLDIRGRIDVCKLSPLTLYATFLVFKTTPNLYGLVDQPIEVRVGLVDGDAAERTVYLNSEGRVSVMNQQDLWRVHRHSSLMLPRLDSGMELQEDERADDRIQLPIQVGLPYRSNDLRLQDGRGEGREGCPEERGDGWLEIGLGEFFCEGGCDGEMEVRIMEVKQLSWKSGLIIQGIEIRPKEV